MFLCKFAFRKLGADSKPSCVRKTNSSCPPRPAKGLSPLESQVRFYASLPAANLVRTVDQTISVEPSLSRPPSPKNPELVLRGGWFFRSFYASLRSANLERTVNRTVSIRPIFTVRRGRKCIKSSKICSLPPNQTCSRQKTEL